MQSALALDSLLRRDRYVVVTGLLAVAAIAWAYTVWLAWDMRGMDSAMAMDGMVTEMESPPDGMAAMESPSGGRSMRMPMTADWTAADFGFMYAMWGVMMVAMMIPSAAPMILTFGLVARKRKSDSRPYAPTGVFIAGYLLAWFGFALAAVLAQWGLHAASLVSPMGTSTNAALGGILLIAAGLFQYSPLKGVCLTECRSPLGFLMAEWREGAAGALNMGVRHGLYCLGCCWVLMLLLFVLGVMNLLWIAALAGIVLLEKAAPKGGLIARASGALLVVWGVATLATGIV